jgi:hypothetical protein
VWERKSVPAATIRRERIEGECVGVGEGRRRDMSRAKQPPLSNSASGDELSSAIGANYSICGPTPQPAEQTNLVGFGSSSRIQKEE